MANIHIVPVNTKDSNRIIQAFRHYKVDKVYLIEGSSPVADKKFGSLQAQKEVKNFLKQSGIPFDETRVDVVNFLDSFNKILKIVSAERKGGSKIHFNISASTHIPSSAIFNICAFFKDLHIYYTVPAGEYKPGHGKTEGLSEIVELPCGNYTKIPKIQEAIIDLLMKMGSKAESQQHLIEMFLSNSKEYTLKKTSNSLISYHVNELTKKGFVMSNKSGKQTELELTLTGKVYHILNSV
ncbi:DUF6293 family protein [Candidatus Undinarchaeota archaeon]